MDYSIVSKNPKQFLSLTTLKIEEFEQLLQYFEPRWDGYYRYHTLEGERRKHPRTKEHGNARLQGTAQKLFFLLVYLKKNELQEHQAASFGISQSKVSRIVRILMPILNKALKDMGLTPLRDGERLKKKLADHPDKVFSYDGTDRGINRNSDKDAQEVEYSGKHHGHMIKNLTLCDNQQYVHYLSPTCPGSQHDKSIADEFPIQLPEKSVLKQDLGFLGHAPEGVIIEQPFKKPKNGTLSFGQKIYNKLLSSTRIVVEHANSGIKRLRIVKDTIRVHSPQIRDDVMVIACGLHNFRVRSEFRAYSESRV